MKKIPIYVFFKFGLESVYERKAENFALNNGKNFKNHTPKKVGRPRTIPPTNKYKIRTPFNETPIFVKSNLNLTASDIKIKLQKTIEELDNLKFPISLLQYRLFDGETFLRNNYVVFRTKKY